MEDHKITQKTGRLLILTNFVTRINLGGRTFRPFFVSFCVTLVATRVLAAPAHLSAEVDSTSIAIQETVSLKITVQTQGNTQVENIEFNAPDFQVAGEFSSFSMSSRYDSSAGGYSSVNTQQVTKVLKPIHAGNLRIAHIQASVGGKLLSAPDIVIQVSNSGTSHGQGSGLGNNLGNGLGNNLGGGSPFQGQPFGQIQPVPRSGNLSQRRSKISGTQAVLRAETDKSTPYYKGEQVIVSYYLYHQMKVFNVQVDKFPVLNGFLREDLDVPVMGQRLGSEPAVLNGVPYERSLLAQYAAYPLEDGKMDVDAISLKFNFYPKNSSAGDEEDLFFGFFQQMIPKVWSGQSDPLSIEVLPLPETGKPNSFTGGIGDFNLISAVDKTEVHANDAVTLTVKVSGHGNASALKAPQVKWPDHLELYDSKGKSLPGRKGMNEKVFEYLLIPRVPGKIVLPSLEFGFFDPIKKTYYVKSTPSETIQVLGAAPGTQLVPSGASQGSGLGLNSNDLKGLKPLSTLDQRPAQTGSFSLTLDSIYREFINGSIIYGILFFAFSILLSLIGYDQILALRLRLKNAKMNRVIERSQTFVNLKQTGIAALSGASWRDVLNAYELLTEELFDVLDERFGLGARSFSRSQLEHELVEGKGLSRAVWDRMVRLFEFADTIRFASGSSGVVSEALARQELARWVDEAETLFQLIKTSS